MSSIRAIYIHIPFCSKKCHYCDFTAYVPNKDQQINQYLRALVQEMKMISETYPSDRVDSIFIGGGTPSLLSPEQMEFLLVHLKKYFPRMSEAYEFTVEANPETTTMDLLLMMYRHGVNRISFGVQTFNSGLLANIGRSHGVDDVYEGVKNARQVGIENLSLDIMFGLPGQTIKDMEETLDRAVALDPEHFSCYSLKVEEGTRFHALHMQNKLGLPSEEHEFEMYQYIRSFLQEKTYFQYEISNFSKIGKESKHNITYWLNEEYYGFGVGAHGYIRGDRYENVKGISAYIERCESHHLPIRDSEKVTAKEDRENFMILGLRLMEGISKRRFFNRYHEKVTELYKNELEVLEKKGLLMCQGDRIFLTEKGILFGNDVFSTFLS